MFDPQSSLPVFYFFVQTLTSKVKLMLARAHAETYEFQIDGRCANATIRADHANCNEGTARRARQCGLKPRDRAASRASPNQPRCSQLKIHCFGDWRQPNTEHGKTTDEQNAAEKFHGFGVGRATSRGMRQECAGHQTRYTQFTEYE
jgi:hypothetical protein